MGIKIRIGFDFGIENGKAVAVWDWVWVGIGGVSRETYEGGVEWNGVNILTY